MEKTQLIEVQNRSGGMLGYKIPEDNIRRIFAPGEIKKITLGELEKLTFQEGGKTLIADYLLLKNPAATEDLNIHTEQEYWYTEDQIIELMKNGSEDEFLDALDFAPQGVLDLIKDFAVKLPLNDYNKRQAIKEKLHFDVDKAIENDRASHETEDAPVQTHQRRVQPKENESAAPVRRAENKYTVVKK